MKACLMKVNYSPAYTAPHKIGTFDNYKGRLNHTKDIYGSSEKQLRHNLEEAVAQKRTKLKTVFRENGQNEKEKIPVPEHSANSSPTHSKKANLTSEAVAKRVLSRNGGGLKDDSHDKKSHRTSSSHFDQHKEGVAKAHHSIRLQPLKHNSASYNISTPGHLGLGAPAERYHNDISQRLLSGPYTQKLCRSASHLHSSQTHHSIKHLRARPSTGSHPHSDGIPGYQRSKTVPPATNAPNEPVRISFARPPGYSKLERKARREAEKAMKDKKVFTIIGPYTSLRAALRRRGWVERFANAPSPNEILTNLRLRKPGEESPVKYTEHDDDDADGGPKTKPWEEENGIYGMMSHALRNATPTFLFSVKTVDVDSRVTKSNQLVNHFSKARSFTTKTGLCEHIKDTVWFETADHNTFYPRCYKFDDPIEKESFLEDFRLSSCFGFLKCFVEKYKYILDKRKDSDLPESEPIIIKPAEEYKKEKEKEEAKKDEENKEAKLKAKPSLLNSGSRKTSLLSDITEINLNTREEECSADSMIFSQDIQILRGGPTVPVRAYEMAMQQTSAFLRFRHNDDIDAISDRENQFSSSSWETFINWYYQFTDEGGELTTVTDHMVKNTQEILLKVKNSWPQYELDGFGNIWIVKPGAMSRGRGIKCEKKLDVILGSVEEGDDTMVVQKYIERPLLVYNTKFDIRQWFLITDWNPLTIWFYKDCYLRFCTQEFSLTDFHESIHLSNNCIQKNYSVNEKRSQQLPEDNMWTGEEFDRFLRQNGKGSVWQDVVVAGMKNAITCIMMCTQEHIEHRKGAFELYGADFMLTEDMSPWLIEINSSPSMARNTRATCKLVDSVLEDTLKVVLDRREDKNCDTGLFEMIYKQGPINDPPSVDHSLAIVGKKVVKKKNSKTNNSGV